jgi:hypothetical protein
MRILLTFMVFLPALSVKISAQTDFLTLDKRSYEYYLNSDYRNLKKTADSMITSGIDYYYLRMRLGIIAYLEKQYSVAATNFTKALKFNSADTVSREYLYNCYILSGRKADARLYLESLPEDQKNNVLNSEGTNNLMEVYMSSSATGYETSPYETNNYYFEDINKTFSISAGLESFFSKRLKGTFVFTNYRKDGTIYTRANPSGAGLDFNQNQFYTRVTGYTLTGWAFSGFGHAAFYSDGSTDSGTHSEYLFGLGVMKNGWKIRAGANSSYSNFSYSNQLRGEAYLTWLPFGNLNLYLTSGWMGQTDRNWGGTYQINGEIGLKLFKLLWLESGIISGNSFLFAREQGLILNNSFLIPATVIYSNLIILAGKRFSITLTPAYSENLNYSWDLNAYSTFNKQNNNSFGGIIKLTYKNN